MPQPRAGPYRSEYERPVGLVTDKSLRVFIAGICLEDLEREGENALRAEMDRFGAVDRYTLFTNKAGRFTGSGICTFRTAEAAAECIRTLNRRANPDGTFLKVEHSREDGVELAATLQARDRELATLNDDGRWARGRLPPPSTWRGGRGHNRGRGEGGSRGRGRGHNRDDDLPPLHELDAAIASYQVQREDAM